jgi:hypothetical protein
MKLQGASAPLQMNIFTNTVEAHVSESRAEPPGGSSGAWWTDASYTPFGIGKCKPCFSATATVFSRS